MSARRLGTKVAMTAIFVSAAICAQQASAQQTVAKLKDPKGTVLVSQGDAMAAGAAEQALRPGTRVVTSAGASVIVSYDKGCDVRLQENQRFTVREFGECPALIAAVEGTGVAVAAGVGAGAAAGAGGVSTLAVLGGVAVVGGAAYAIDHNRRNKSPD